MNHTYRSTRRHVPSVDETLIGSKEEAYNVLADLDVKLGKAKIPRQDRATFLSAKATIYEALGDQKMLDAAYDAWDFQQNANTAALVAVALHHFGRIEESLKWYKKSYCYPHEQGFEIDIGYSGALLFEGNWTRAWPIVKALKKRMVYALYLPFWDGKPVKELSIVSEGGFGDLIHNSRYLPLVSKLAENVTVYLPPYFFDYGFSDLAADQPWFPKIKSLLELPQGIPAAGFFDLPAIFNTQPTTIPTYPDTWKANPEYSGHYKKVFEGIYIQTPAKPKVGFCWEARAMETPLCPKGVYRALTDEQAKRIVKETSEHVNLIGLQPGGLLEGCHCFDLKSWRDTAAIIEQLDLVVTVDTGVAHLAAGMGKPTWVILSGAVDWKFGLSGDKCPWYPAMRLFRNDAFGFENSVSNVIEAINGL